MNLVSVFSQHIVTLQNVFLDDLQRLPGSWNLMSWSLQSRFARFACYSSDYWLGELLLVFFYKANPPPQSWKSKQWYPGSSMGFSGTDFPFFRGAFEMRIRHRCLAWESITASFDAQEVQFWSRLNRVKTFKVIVSYRESLSSMGA